MATKISFYDDIWLNRIAYDKTRENEAETNTHFISKLKKLIIHAIENDLTDRQKNMLKLYYFDNMNIPQIAHYYSLNKSTVSRHINNAKKKIKYLMKYVMLLTNQR